MGNILVDGENEYAPDVLDAMSILFGKNPAKELEGYDLSEKEINRLLEIKKKISDNMINVSKAIEISSIPIDSHPEILEEIIRNKISVKKLREMKRAIKENIDEQNTDLSNGNNSYFFKTLKIAKKASLSLRVSLARIDNLIEEVEVTIEPENRTEIINFLMEIRLKIHELIDETIRFKNYSRKTIKI